MKKSQIHTVIRAVGIAHIVFLMVISGLFQQQKVSAHEIRINVQTPHKKITDLISQSDINKALLEQKITALEAEMQLLYGGSFKITQRELPETMKDLPLIAELPTDTNNEALLLALQRLKKIMKKYPPRMIRKSGLTNIYFVNKIGDKTGHMFAGVQYEHYIFIDINFDVIGTFDHEFYHLNETTDGDVQTKDSIWTQVNPTGTSVYRYPNGFLANLAGRGAGSYIPILKGFARIYGKNGGPPEDRATIGEVLLNPERNNALLVRAKTDNVLKKKIESLTACVFDQELGRFSRQYTREEYKREYGYEDYQYYARWSPDKNGDIVMNCEYWNEFAKGNPPTYDPELVSDALK